MPGTNSAPPDLPIAGPENFGALLSTHAFTKRKFRFSIALATALFPAISCVGFLLVEGDNTPFFCTVPFGFFLMIAGLAYGISQRGKRVDIYARGLISRDGQRIEAIAWKEVVFLDVSGFDEDNRACILPVYAPQKDTPPVDRTLDVLLKGNFFYRTKLRGVFRPAIALPITVAGYSRMARSIYRALIEVKRDEIDRTLFAGGSVAFGLTRLSKEGIDRSNGYAFLKWHKLAGVDITNSVVRIHHRGPYYCWLEIPLKEIDNLPIFIYTLYRIHDENAR